MNEMNDTVPHRDAPPPWFVIGCFLIFVVFVSGVVGLCAMGISYLIKLISGG